MPHGKSSHRFRQKLNKRELEHHGGWITSKQRRRTAKLHWLQWNVYQPVSGQKKMVGLHRTQIDFRSTSNAHKVHIISSVSHYGMWLQKRKYRRSAPRSERLLKKIIILSCTWDSGYGILRKDVAILWVQGRLHNGGMVRDAPWRKLGGVVMIMML